MFLNDARFTVFVEGEGEFLSRAWAALARPVRCLFLGSSECVPADFSTTNEERTRLVVGLKAQTLPEALATTPARQLPGDIALRSEPPR